MKLKWCFFCDEICVPCKYNNNYYYCMKNEARCVISWMYSCCYRSVLQKIQCVCVCVCVCVCYLFTDIFLKLLWSDFVLGNKSTCSTNKIRASERTLCTMAKVGYSRIQMITQNEFSARALLLFWYFLHSAGQNLLDNSHIYWITLVFMG